MLNRIVQFFSLITIITALSTAAIASSNTNKKIDSNMSNTLHLELKDGIVVIELLPEIAPNHVARIKELASEGFYDGIVFHRVIEDFMAQTGDPTGTGMGGSDKGNIKAEFSVKPHTRGAVSMARANDPNSANSQFFIVLKDSNFLDKNYTLFGYVTEGMQFVDNIKKGDPGRNGKVDSPDKIISLRVASQEVAKEKESADTEALQQVAE